MSSYQRFTEALHGRLLLAALAAGTGIGGAACRKETAPAPVNGLCGKEKPQEICYEPFAKHVSAVGTGEPGPAPAASAYDKDGCVAKAEVSNGCCNPAADGPRVRDGKCCYNFCPGSCCGRPFLVGGRPRVAALMERDDWVLGGGLEEPGRESAHDDGAIDALVDAPSGAMAEALRNAWLGDAQMEHASSAAFGRFVLQLLALGAPARFVRDAALAAADEVRHAELCFALAARFGGESGAAYGPMPLALDGALDARTIAEVVAEVVAEGCVGETVAAVVASRQLEGTRDPAVREALRQISADEAKHAELAWAFVRWAIEVGGDEARASAARAFEVALGAEDGKVCAERGVDASAWHAYGRLSGREQRETARRARVEIIGPCARALLEGGGGPALALVDGGLGGDGRA